MCPPREWFRLGRAVTPVGNGAALVSWSGSMFEYLMPSLVMRAPEGSLLADTSQLIVQRQIDFGAARAIPWGVSESAYNARDLEYTYQYSNFGIPGLGLKRGLGLEAVVAPYATALAAMVDPQRAVLNLGRLAAIGGQGALWLLRGDGFHARPHPHRPIRGAGTRLHGPSPGYVHSCDRGHGAGRHHAHPLPRRADDRRHGTPAAGTRPA